MICDGELVAMTYGPAEMSAAAEGELHSRSAELEVDAAISGLNSDCHALDGVRKTTTTWCRLAPWRTDLTRRYWAAAGLLPCAPRRTVAWKSASPMRLPSLHVAPRRSW